MGGLNVKNTIVEKVLEFIAPHPCSGCGKVGVILCSDCKYDIINEPFLGCILCGTPQITGICQNHSSAISRAFVVGERHTTLEAIINRLKFERTKAASTVTAQLLDEALPILPNSTVLVPIPTVRSHIRQRGYDQVDLIARRLAALRGYTIYRGLERVTNITQHTSSRGERQRQASDTFTLHSPPPKDALLLVIDDIITTGATVSAAAKLLNQQGNTVWVAALAYQPLD